MSIKDMLIDKLNKKVTALEKEVDAENARVEEAKAKAMDEQSSAKLKEEATSSLSRMKQKINEANSYIEELQKESEENISAMKDKIEKFFD